MIIGGSGSGKTNALLNLINNEPDIHKIYLYAKDQYKGKHQLLINKRESAGLKYCNDSKAFIEHEMIWTMFLKILKPTIQIKREKYWSYLMIWLLTCNSSWIIY